MPIRVGMHLLHDSHLSFYNIMKVSSRKVGNYAIWGFKMFSPLGSKIMVSIYCHLMQIPCCSHGHGLLKHRA